MTADVWNDIKDLDLATNGGWTIDAAEHFLYLVKSDVFGATEWALAPVASAPDGAFQAPMSSGDWADLKGGTLSTQANTITWGRAATASSSRMSAVRPRRCASTRCKPSVRS